MTDLMVSVLVISPATFLEAKQRAKLDLQEDMRLEKAATLTAQRNTLLTSTNPDDLKVAQLKALNKQVNYWTKRVRQPFGELSTGLGDPNDDADDAAPTQATVSALVKTIKKPATPAVNQAAANVRGTPTVQKRRCPWDYLTPKPTPPPRPAKIAAKKKLTKIVPDPQEPSTSGTPTRTPKSSQILPWRPDSDGLLATAKSYAKESMKKQAPKTAKEAGKRLAKSWLKL